ncbi:MAG: succinate dehydrogenase flavoprotein subunit [Phycisphaerales bacterium]
MAEPSNQQRVIVVGGGLAGLAACVRIAEAGIPVDLFSIVPVKRSHSVCAQGGINACNEVARQQGYSEYEHFDETVYGGDFLAHQPPVYEMTHMAPKVIDLLDRMGVPFNRTAEGQRDLRLFGGSLYKRTHFSGATTGQQLMYALDEQTRRYEAEGKVTKYEHWEFLRPIVDASGRCRGIVAQDLRTMDIRAFRGDAVVMATGGNGLVFGHSTNSVMCTGAAAARCYQQGVWYGNGEFVQVHPTAIPGADKLRLMSESARGEGGRVWVPAVKGGDGKWSPHPRSGEDAAKIPDNERWYFLEEKYPAYGNIVPRDIATREIFQVCMDGFGIGGRNEVYLDLTHKSREFLETRLGGIMEIYRKFVGDDPVEKPMRIFPGVHYTMGGLWTTYTPKKDLRGMELGAANNMMTNVPGLYAFGEVNYQYHGANRLGANALLSCIFDGLYNGFSVVMYTRDMAGDTAASQESSLFDSAVQGERDIMKALTESKGGENPYAIAKELGKEMTAASTVVKTEARLKQALGKVAELRERAGRISLADIGMWSNQTLSWARAVKDMVALADPILRGGLERQESRGSHFRTDYPERDDERFLKTTVAEYDRASGGSKIRFEDVEVGLVTPRKRDYSKAGKPKVEKDSPGSSGPASSDDPKAARRVSDPNAEPDVRGQKATSPSN